MKGQLYRRVLFYDRNRVQKDVSLNLDFRYSKPKKDITFRLRTIFKNIVILK